MLPPGSERLSAASSWPPAEWAPRRSGIGREAAGSTSSSMASTRSAAANYRPWRASRRHFWRAVRAPSSATAQPRSSGASGKTAPATVDVTIVGRVCGLRKGIRVHRIRAIEDRDVRHHEGLWVSSPARAVLEVAAVAPGELVDLMDEGLARRLLNRRDLEAVLARNRPCRGAARLAALLGDESAMTITRSDAEKAFLRLIRDARLPVPRRTPRSGADVPDFIWRRERLIVETRQPDLSRRPGRLSDRPREGPVLPGRGLRRHAPHARARGARAGDGAGQSRAGARAPIATN